LFSEINERQWAEYNRGQGGECVTVTEGNFVASLMICAPHHILFDLFM
jgi:hypothetical protein